jgi:hypothetical protein
MKPYNPIAGDADYSFARITGPPTPAFPIFALYPVSFTMTLRRAMFTLSMHDLILLVKKAAFT